MDTTLSPVRLQQENVRFFGSGARSEENREQGFRPAFRDSATGRVYPSRFGDGRPAPFHLLDGLPDEVVARRDAAGRVAVLCPSVVSGFVLDGHFFTRDEAAAWAASAWSH